MFRSFYPPFNGDLQDLFIDVRMTNFTQSPRFFTWVISIPQKGVIFNMFLAPKAVFSRQGVACL